MSATGERITLETVSVVDAAAARLRESLFAGEFRAGEELRDTRIAADYGIARPTARSVVQRLVAEGVLVREPGLSARVRAFPPGEVRDLFRVRRLIELDAIAEIHARRGDLASVRLALDGFAALPDEVSWSRVAEADVGFHSAVVAAAGSPRLRDIFAGIAGELRLLIALLRPHYSGGSVLYAEHEELFALLQTAPLDRLQRAWDEHLRSAQSVLTGGNPWGSRTLR